MHKPLILLIIVLLSNQLTNAKTPRSENDIQLECESGINQETELNNFWNEVSRSVQEGDFEGYKATYHIDGVVVFTTRENKRSVSISNALSDWKSDFDNVQNGVRTNNVQFRFSQRVNDETSAHETGVFYYTSIDENGEFMANAYINFEALLVKKEGRWLMLMEYQKSKATEADWNALK